MSLAAILSIAFIGAAVARPLTPLLGGASGWVLSLFPLTVFTAFLLKASEIIDDNIVVETWEWIPSLGVEFALRLDGFSLLFALLISGIGTLVTIYASAYFSKKSAGQAGRFLAFILLFMAVMLATVLADNLIVMFVFWELTSLTSFLLIGFDSSKYDARRAALQSLLVTGGGGLALFAAILLIGSTLGTFSLTEVSLRADELAANPLLPAILVLVLIGAFTKSAQFPFHFWLPNAMQAPTPASAYLHSATMVKLGVYLLARFDSIFASTPAFGITLVIFGSVTMLVAAFEALRSTGYKAVLAQSTVASLGILVMLIGLDGEVAAVATVGFIITHAFYKAALFFCAGTVIHATGIAGLRKLGGLARYLPFTAAAALLASLSMAGLPPFIGFISKEYLFEAQLESGWNGIPVVVAVIVNAIMVGVAGVVSLRPFFRKPRRNVTVHHGETPGLLIGPLLLALGGIVMGVFPNLVISVLVEPAAGAVHGAPIDVSFQLWHGLTPMLALSGLVVAIGTTILVYWDNIHSALRRQRRLQHLFGDRGYQRTFDFVLAVASRSTRILQNGDQHKYSAVAVATTVVLVATGLWVSGAGIWHSRLQGSLDIPVAVVLLLAMAGAASAIRARSLIAAVVAVGVVGFGSAVIFMLNGAPDLALTQFAVETLFVVIVTAALVRLPARGGRTRSTGERRNDAALAMAFAAVTFLAVASMTASPLDMRLSDYFAQTSLTEAFGRNVVNVILVDFRAIDTLGEITVVAFATLAVWCLLRRGQLKQGE